MAYIPLELVRSIIDVLAIQGHKTDLNTASLISRLFREACLTHLFSSIAITLHPSSKARNEQLAHILTHNPRIGEVVRTLHVTFTDAPSADSDLLSNMFRALPGIRHLTLYSDRMSHFHWHLLPSNIQQSILHLLTHPQSEISHLAIRNIAVFPVAYLSRCSSLQHLECRALGHVPFSFIPDDETLPQGHLRSLKLLEVSPFIDVADVLLHSPHSSLTLSRLQTLECWILHNAHPTTVQSILSTASSAVQSLTLHVFTGQALSLFLPLPRIYTY
jgi:hypothetical protein